ncbi:MAG: hypothetical protein ACYDC1_16285 [Limisphaerales bacterium]
MNLETSPLSASANRASSAAAADELVAAWVELFAASETPTMLRAMSALPTEASVEFLAI